MLACRTAGVAQTRALGAAVAAVVDVGDVVVLVGDLGAGKTAFVQGFAASLGVVAPVTSPTFTLANRYEGRLVVNHLDVYRFDRPEEASDLALPEILDEGVTLVEWGDTISSALPAEHLSVRIRFGDHRDHDSHDGAGRGVGREGVGSDGVGGVGAGRDGGHDDGSTGREGTGSDGDDDGTDNGGGAGTGRDGDCGDDDRRFELWGRGESWQRRADRLRFALEPWALPC